MDVKRESFSIHSPRVAIISRKSFLAALLAERLSKESFTVEIFTDQKSSWGKSISEKGTPFKIYDLKEMSGHSFEYAISLNINSPQEDFNKNFLLAEKELILFTARYAKKYSSKSIFVFPFIQEGRAFEISSNWIKELLNDRNLFAGIVYLGEIICRGDFLIGNNGLAKVLRSFAKNSPIIISKEEKYFYPLDIEDAVDGIIRSLFSLKAYGEETAIISQQLTVVEILTTVEKIRPGLRVLFEDQVKNVATPAPQEFIRKHFDYENFLPSLVERFEVGDNIAKKKTPTERITPKSANFLASLRSPTRALKIGLERTFDKLRKDLLARAKILMVLVSLIIIFIAFPWLLLGASLSGLTTAKRSLGKDDLGRTEKSLKISLAVSKIANEYCLALAKLPIFGEAYESLSGISLLLADASQAGLTGTSLLKNILELASDVADEGLSYDPEVYAEKISLDLDSFYKELGFLEGEINSSQNFSAKKIRGILDDVNIAEVRQKILFLEKIVAELPQLLGKGKPVTYLILFQNSSLLYPTGGAIDAFGLVTITDGKITEVKVFSSDSTDALLRGYVEPPAPLKKYFGEKTWFLKYSNWDPDFSISGAKAEWFIDKEIDRSVDGAIGLDLEFLKSFLKKVGPMSLEKSGKKVSSENLDDLIQKDKSTMKDTTKTGTDFFTEFSQEFLNQILRVDPKKRMELLKEMVKSLEEKHLQLFLHNVVAQRALSDLRWAGEVYQLECRGNCYVDFFGVVEANTKDSVVAPSVKKEVDLTVSFERGLIKRRLMVFLDNSSSGKSDGNYKSYVRILAPEDAGFGPVEIVDGKGRESVGPEVYGVRGHKEAGVFVELLPGETKALLFSWESGTVLDFDREGEYLFSVRKQGGGLAYPVEVRFSFPEGLKVKSVPGFSLTEGGFIGYNTLLSRDFISRIFW